MRGRIRQIVAGIATGLAAVALAVFVTHLFGIRVATGSAGGSGSAPPQAAPSVLTQPGDPAQDFSVLRDARIDPAPPSVIQEWQSAHPGSYSDAKTVAAGMYLSSNGDSLCASVAEGFSQCTGSDDLNAGDAWLQGDMRRMSDSESAPFEVNLYGFARDGVSAIRVSTSAGKATDLAVANNGFRGTLGETSFSDITELAVVYSSGKTVSLDPSNYFPRH